MLNRSKVILLAFFLLSFCFPVYAGVGTEGAAFLNIPVGAGPAALGSAYSALAADAYAPTYNPGGLGFLPSTQLSGQHLSYLDSNHYEYLSFVHPLTHTLSPTSGGEGVRVRGPLAPPSSTWAQAISPAPTSTPPAILSIREAPSPAIMRPITSLTAKP